MKDKKETRCSRSELADYLADLSQQLRRGRLDLQGRTLAVPEEVGLEFHLKEEEGAIAAKLSWRWSARTPAGQAASTKNPPPASWKAVKTALAASFKEVQRVLGQGLCPEESLLRELLANSQAFAGLARREWQEPLAQFMAHVENFRRAGENRQLQAMQQELQELAHRMAACHRDFK
jgi:XXXCH domain-containing protein